MICAFCLTPLPNQSDQYGPIQAPLCQSCWLWHSEIDCPVCNCVGHCEACQNTGSITIDRLQLLANPNNPKLAHTGHRLLSKLEAATQ